MKNYEQMDDEQICHAVSMHMPGRYFNYDGYAWDSDEEVQFWPTTNTSQMFQVMDELLIMLTGISLNQDGSATGMIGSDDVTVEGGHCRAICILFLMAKELQNKIS